VAHDRSQESSVWTTSTETTHSDPYSVLEPETIYNHVTNILIRLPHAGIGFFGIRHKSLCMQPERARILQVFDDNYFSVRACTCVYVEFDHINHTVGRATSTTVAENDFWKMSPRDLVVRQKTNVRRRSFSASATSSADVRAPFAARDLPVLGRWASYPVAVGNR